MKSIASDPSIDDPVVGQLLVVIGRGGSPGRPEAARRLLELLEPESLDTVLRLVAASGEPTPETLVVLRDAWEAYRHDRGRSWN